VPDFLPPEIVLSRFPVGMRSEESLLDFAKIQELKAPNAKKAG